MINKDEITKELRAAEIKLGVIAEAFGEVSESLEKLNDVIDACETINFVNEENQKKIKLTRKQRRENAKKYLKNRYPKLFISLTDIKEMLDAFAFEIGDISENAQTAIENIGEAENLIEEAREKLDELR